ncbi:hypothetical protein FRX31_010207 [Thalictrum thalictroides]|uniref:Uncharacterized protein n=1 Tax=Thalictrum thalictroides TaxID=46969 RepID=A0A7J6WS64_THATH|nr:hypothetical protein FRX31_010207 [Thalictrum thalictroides]
MDNRKLERLHRVRMNNRKLERLHRVRMNNRQFIGVIRMVTYFGLGVYDVKFLFWTMVLAAV